MKPIVTTHQVQINFSVACKKPYLNKVINRISTILSKSKITTFSITHQEQFDVSPDFDAVKNSIIDEEELDIEKSDESEAEEKED